MSKIYQPIVLETAEEILQSLIETEFFIDYEIEDTSYAKEYLCDVLTEKYIINGLDLEMGIFTEEEFNVILKEIAAGSVLKSLKEKGYINSYGDDNTEEMFFLTEEGKEYLKNMSQTPGINPNEKK